MSDITIKLLEGSDAEELFQFELENRNFFESMVPSRGDHYYDFDNFKTVQQEINLSHLSRENFIAKISYIGKNAPNMDVKETVDYVRVDCGLPSDTYNVSVIRSNNLLKSAEDILGQTVHYFTEKNFPMALWVWENEYKDMIDILEKVNLVESETNMAMFACLHTLISENVPIKDFIIKDASCPPEVEGFGDLLATLFGESQEAKYIRKYYSNISRLPFLENGAMKLYIGLFRGEIVSTGSLFITEDSVGIYDIATRPNHQGKGFGTAMFQFLLSVAKKQDTDLCILQASPDGMNIYEKTGFQSVCRVKVFENRRFIDLMKT